jgi:Na+/melibiose symporter-like transporter
MYRYVKERVITPSQEKQKILPMLKKFTKNKLLIIMIISTSLANFINLGTIQIYFFTYNMGNPALATILVAMTLPTFFVGGLMTPRLVKRFNKRELMIASALVIVVVNLLFLLGGYKPAIWIVLLVYLVMNFAGSVKGVLYWSMISDTVDYGEWKTHVRNDGLVYAIEGAAMKIIGSIGAMYVGIVISIINFVPNALTQTEATLRGLFYIPQITIAIVTLLSIIPILFYDLDKKKHAMILAELKERKQSTTSLNGET